MATNYDQRLRRLEELRRDVLDRLDGVSETRIEARPADGGWSPVQVLAHVVEAEAKSLAYVRKKIQDPQAIPRRELRQRLNGWLVRAAMKTPFKFKVPPSVGEPPQEVEFEALTAYWQEAREGWREFLADFPAELADRTVYRHPVAGPVTLEAGLRFLVAHLERHKRQIERLLR